MASLYDGIRRPLDEERPTHNPSISPLFDERQAVIEETLAELRIAENQFDNADPDHAIAASLRLEAAIRRVDAAYRAAKAGAAYV